ncbi:hypothetical protein VNO77_22698 [Canavalia gladiata]|uniref:Uncharacterized protein n=1 Tax=Canavalia gladiata TaxID=3824 RepID=A0AAN9L4I2_CANGL
MDEAKKAEEMQIGATNVTGEDSFDNQSAHMFSNSAEAQEDTGCITKESSMATECSPVVESAEIIHVTRDNALPRRSPSTVSNTSDIQIVDGSD